LLSLARERGQRVMGTYDDRGGGGTGSDVTAVAAGSVAGAENSPSWDGTVQISIPLM